MSSWFPFGLSVGKSLVVVGFIDLILSFSKTFSVYGEYLYESKHPDKNSIEWLWQLRNFEILHMSLEFFKIICSFALWIGVIFLCNRLVLKMWIFITTATDFVLIGVLMHHLFVEDSNPSWKVFYSWSLRMFLRLCMVSVAYHFAQRDAFPEEDVGGKKEELLPIGEYLPNIWRFYTSPDSNNGPQLLLSVDLIWSIFQIFENEMDQILFGRNTLGVISSNCTPILVEERFIRTLRIIFDFVFLFNIQKGQPALGRLWIVPLVLSIVVSVGILLVVMLQEHGSLPPVVAGFFYFSSILDIIFRFTTFCLCLKSYSLQLVSRT